MSDKERMPQPSVNRGWGKKHQKKKTGNEQMAMSHVFFKRIAK